MEFCKQLPHFLLNAIRARIVFCERKDYIHGLKIVRCLPLLRIQPLCKYRQGFLLVHLFVFMVSNDFWPWKNTDKFCSVRLEFRSQGPSTLQIFPSLTTHVQGVFCFEGSKIFHRLIYNWFTHWQTVNHWVKSTVKVGGRFSELRGACGQAFPSFPSPTPTFVLFALAPFSARPECEN